MLKSNEGHANTATNFFINLLIDKYKLQTDYQVAKFLGVNTCQISNYRYGRREFSDTNCLDIAEKLEYPKQIVLLSVWASREKNPEIRKVYRQLLDDYNH